MTVRTYTNVTLNTNKNVHLQAKQKNIYKYMTKKIHLLQTSRFLSFVQTQKLGLM